MSASEGGSRKLKVEFWGHFPLPRSYVEVEAAVWKWRVDTLVNVDKSILVRAEKVYPCALF